eukprot:COSAG02_NODE_6845_length_3329_cov_85.690093_1_plen_137_part_10
MQSIPRTRWRERITKPHAASQQRSCPCTFDFFGFLVDMEPAGISFNRSVSLPGAFAIALEATPAPKCSITPWGTHSARPQSPPSACTQCDQPLTCTQSDKAAALPERTLGRHGQKAFKEDRVQALRTIIDEVRQSKI